MKRILVIDDEEQIRNVLKKILERSGYKVSTANNGADGLHKFKRNPSELVITDLTMPEMDGMEAITRITKLAPGTKIIAISGGGERFPDYFLPMAGESGAHMTFKKPVSAKEIVRAVEEMIGEGNQLAKSVGHI